MNHLCCIDVTLSARFVGAYGMAMSILMINVLVGEFLDEHDESLSSQDVWVLLGHNWAEIMDYSSGPQRSENIQIFFTVYTMLYLLGSAVLVLGSISRKGSYAIPWLILQIFSGTAQAVALVTHHSYGKYHYNTTPSPWYLPISSVYLLITVYFWLVVFAAQKLWVSAPPNDTSNFYMASYRPSDETQVDIFKTPSVLAQNRSIFESPQPPIASKYDQV